jgi:hypothetical protein
MMVWRQPPYSHANALAQHKQPRLTSLESNAIYSNASRKKVAIRNARRMDADGDAGDVFAIPDFWNPSPYIREVQESHSFLFSELRFGGERRNSDIWGAHTS